MDLIIADTFPLILLAKLDLLESVCRIFRVAATAEVFHEATCKKELPDAMCITRIVQSGYIRVETVDSEAVTSMRDEWKIGLGEASVFVLAQLAPSVLMLDDYAAISIARAEGLRYITTPVLIYELGRRNHLSVRQATDKLVALKQHAWISDDVIEQVLCWLGKGVN